MTKCRIALLACGLLLATACGGSSEPATDTTGAFSPAPASTELSPGDSTAAPGDQTFIVDQHFWHSGFRVEVTDGEIESTEDQLSGRVRSELTLNLTLENLGADTGYFGPAIAISTDNNSYPYNGTTELPDVPGGLTSQGTLTFVIDDGFTLDGAEMVVGDGGENQARIPLDGNGEAVRLEPSEPAVSGTLTMELIDLTFTSASLRFDIPDRHREVGKGKQALTLSFDALSRKSGNWQIFANNFALIGPDGAALAADGIEAGSLPGSDAGVTTPDLFIRFLVDEDAGGDYTLRFTPGNWFVGDDGRSEATFTFTLP